MDMRLYLGRGEGRRVTRAWGRGRWNVGEGRVKRGGGEVRGRGSS
jgi:hypothetical protein